VAQIAREIERQVAAFEEGIVDGERRSKWFIASSSRARLTQPTCHAEVALGALVLEPGAGRVRAGKARAAPARAMTRIASSAAPPPDRSKLPERSQMIARST